MADFFFDSEREAYFISLETLWRDIGIGLAIGAMFIFLNLLNPNIAIGIPLYLKSVGGAWLVAVLIAPFVEEVFFSTAIFSSANYLLHWSIAIFLRSFSFMVFHLVAYGSSLQGLPTAFIAAFVFSVVVSIVTKYTKSITSGIVTHSTFNAFLGLSKLIVVGA